MDRRPVTDLRPKPFEILGRVPATRVRLLMLAHVIEVLLDVEPAEEAVVASLETLAEVNRRTRARGSRSACVASASRSSRASHHVVFVPAQRQ
jgi:hypothetical protein